MLGPSGCGQRVFLTENDFHAHATQGLDELLEPAPAEAIIPTIRTVPISTVQDLERKKRPISLAECLAIALEQGRLGTDSIRVLQRDPAVAGVDMEQALSRFDALWQSSMNWNKLDTPTGPNVSDVNTQDTAQFSSGLFKPLASGGVAGISFATNYAFSNATPGFNPAFFPNLQPGFNPVYSPTLQFTFEQPLLKGYGVYINQLLAAHPNSVLNPLPGAAGPGILLARLTFDQSRADFERKVQDLAVAVEQAYWNLYCSYWVLYSRETALRLALEEWQVGKKRLDIGQMTVQDLAEIEVQFHAFRGERLQALGSGTTLPGVLEAERQLRLVVGLPPEDGEQLVPSDTPTMAPFVPNWESAVTDALRLRPELMHARQDLELANLAVLRDQNSLLPDLRFVSGYGLNGVGTRLDGPDETNALRSLASNQFTNWTLGLRLTVPIGFRDASSAVRRDRLQLAQRLAALKNQEELAIFDLQRAYRDLIEAQDQMRIQHARRLAAARQVNARLQEFRAGVGEINFLLTAQRSLADAVRDEQQAVCTYNIVMAQFERFRGTILTRDNIEIAERALPEGVARRASEHERERQRALVLREWPSLPRDVVDPADAPESQTRVELPTDENLTPPQFFEAPSPRPIDLPVPESPAPGNHPVDDDPQ
jgi:outer membrane protein TolC